MKATQRLVEAVSIGRRLPLILLAAGLMTVGCAAEYGTLKKSRAAGELFESFQVLPDYTYYYTGGENNPRVIMGIHKDYVLKTSSWIPMTGLDAETLKKRVKAMTDQLGYDGSSQGGVIYSPSGEQAGIWYSQIFKTSIRFGEENTVTVSVPRWFDTDGGGQKKLIQQ